MSETKISPLYLRIMITLSVLAALCFFTARQVEIPFRSALRGWDSSFYHFWLRSLAVDGDWDFRNELEENNTIPGKLREVSRNLPLTEKGRVPNKYGIGLALVSVPFYLLADGIVLVSNALGAENLRRDGFNFVYQICIQFGRFLYAILGVILTFRFCSFWFVRKIAAAATLSVWGSSLLLYYQTWNLSMSHSLTFSLVAAIHYLVLLIEKRGGLCISRWIALFAASGILVVTHYQTVIYLIFPAFVALRFLLRSGPPVWRRVLVSLPFLFAPIALQLLAWKTVYGYWVLDPYAQEGETLNLKGAVLLKVLFSSNHGFFYWHPFPLFGFVGMVVYALEKRSELYLWILTFFMIYLVNASLESWNGAQSFGLRNFEGTIFFAIVGTAYLLEKFNRYNWFLQGFYIASLTSIIWNINLGILFTTSAISRRSSVTISEMLKSTVEFYPWLLRWYFN